MFHFHDIQSSGIFWAIWRIGTRFQVFFNIVTCFIYFLTNYVKIPQFNFLQKQNKGQFKMVNGNC